MEVWPGRLAFNCTMTKAFPNAESTFWDAFNQPNPAPKLLELLTAHLDVKALLNLIVIYMELIGKSPFQFDKFAGALIKLQNSKGITIASGDRLGNPAQLEITHALYKQLHDIHSAKLVIARDPSVTPSNQYLIDSLLSAISIKYRLCDTHSTTVAYGLHYKPKRPYPQVYVLGACLQLLMSGLYLYGPTGTEVGTDDVLATLEKAKNSCVVKDPNGR